MERAFLHEPRALALWKPLGSYLGDTFLREHHYHFPGRAQGDFRGSASQPCRLPAQAGFAVSLVQPCAARGVCAKGTDGKRRCRCGYFLMDYFTVWNFVDWCSIIIAYALLGGSFVRVRGLGRSVSRLRLECCFRLVDVPAVS